MLPIPLPNRKCITDITRAAHSKIAIVGTLIPLESKPTSILTPLFHCLVHPECASGISAMLLQVKPGNWLSQNEPDLSVSMESLAPVTLKSHHSGKESNCFSPVSGLWNKLHLDHWNAPLDGPLPGWPSSRLGRRKENEEGEKNTKERGSLTLGYGRPKKKERQ